MRQPDLVVCDMAGTTVRDAGQVPRAFASALEAHGIVASMEDIADVRGASKREAMLRFVPHGRNREARARAAYETFRECLAGLYRDEGAEPIPGAREVFAWLRGRGARVALTTGFDRDITQLLIEALGWNRDAVDAVVCGDDVPEGRPAPYLIFRAMEATTTHAVRSVAVVGDTTLDLAAGHNAGAGWNIAVLSGAHDRGRLAAAPHTHIVESIAALPAALAGESARP